jgi:hypothetical protein
MGFMVDVGANNDRGSSKITHLLRETLALRTIEVDEGTVQRRGRLDARVDAVEGHVRAGLEREVEPDLMICRGWS